MSNKKTIICGDGTVYQSYSSIIFFLPRDNNEKIFIGRDFDYSNTTKKHVSQWTKLSQSTLKHLIHIGYFTTVAKKHGSTWRIDE